MITIYKGDADTLTETISGLTSLAGYSAKLYIYNTSGTLIDTFTGTISGLDITYEIHNEDTKVWPIGKHNLFTKLWDASDHVYTPSKTQIIVRGTDVSDPV